MASKFENFTNRLFDPGPNVTEKSVQQNQRMADALMAQISQPQNIQHPTQGLALLMNALNAQAYRQQGQRGQEALEKQQSQQMGEVLSRLSIDPQGREMLASLPTNMQSRVLPQLVAGQLMPGDPDTTTKQFREGDEFVTRRVVDGVPDMTEEGVLSRSKIDRISRVEQGEPGAFDPKTKSQQGQDVQEFEDAVIGGVSAIQTGTELLNIATTTPDALGAPGNIFRFGNEMLQTGEALGRAMGIDVGADRSVDEFTFNGFSGNMRDLAIENQAFRSGVYGIAFAAAVAEQGTRPTDKDIQAYIDQIAGSTADPKAFARTLQTFVGRVDRRLRNTANVKEIPQEVRDRAFQTLDRSLVGFNQFFADPLEGIPGTDELTEAEQEELRRLLEQQRGNQR